MKRNILLSVLFLCCFLVLFTGCEEEDTVTEHLCVKCGKTATTSLSGPADILQKNGISISDCQHIASDIYSAYVCDSCVGPVATIKPDAGFTGETPFYSKKK